MPYCIAELKQISEEEGWAPEFPPEVAGFLELASPGRSARWALYEYTLGEEAKWQPAEPVPAEVEALLRFAVRYPPAVALARRKMERMFDRSEPTREEFFSSLASTLSEQLASVADDAFLMAQAVGEKTGYLIRGEWQWILGYVAADRRQVYWVSDDFFVYSDEAAMFDLSRERGARLRVWPNE